MATSTKKTIRSKIGTRVAGIAAPKKIASSRIKKDGKSFSVGNPFLVKDEELLERVQQKAYELFERRGFKDGYADFDWELAETIVKQEIGRARLPAKKRFEFKNPELLSEKIQQKAYELYLSQGQQAGNDEFNWLIAEDLVFLESN